MHEWALAEAIVNYLIKVHKVSNIKKLKVGLGVLQAVDEEVLKFSIKEVASMKGLRVGEVIMIEEPARLKCRVCGTEWIYRPEEMPEEIREAIHFVPEVAHAYLKCPKCGSKDFEIVEGRGVRIVEVVTDD